VGSIPTICVRELVKTVGVYIMKEKRVSVGRDLEVEILRLGRMYDEQIQQLWDAVLDGQNEINRLNNELKGR